MILPCIVLFFSGNARASLIDSFGYACLTILWSEPRAGVVWKPFFVPFRFVELYAIVLIKILDFTTVNEQWKLSDQSL